MIIGFLTIANEKILVAYTALHPSSLEDAGKPSDHRNSSKPSSSPYVNLDEIQAPVFSDETICQGHPDESRTPNASDSASSYSPWSDSSNEEAVDPNSNMQESIYQQPFLDLAKQIIEYLDLLNSLSVAIRRSGTAMRYEKADKSLQISEYTDIIRSLNFYLARKVLNHNKEGITLLRAKSDSGFGSPCNSISIDEALDVRQRLVDPAMISVQDRLVFANVRRRHRIMYARRHAEKMIQSEDFHSEAPPHLDATLAIALKQSGHTHQSTNTPSVPEPQEPRAQSKIPRTATTATGLGSQFNALPPRHNMASTKVTTTGISVVFPRAPRTNPNTSFFQCPYCFLTLDKKYTGKTRWR